MNYASQYLEHLSDQDIDLIARVAEPQAPPAALRARLSKEPGLVDELLAAPQMFEVLFGRPGREIGSRVTPFLTFGVLVYRLAGDLRNSSYVLEWAGPDRRLPLFDVPSLCAFLDDGVRRFFLIEFLASFTRVASGSMWVRTRRGYRRRRYSELDPVRLAELVDQLPGYQRPGGYRRLGDVALFLSGVFPDHTARHPLAAFERERLARSAGVSGVAALDDGRDLGFYEVVGAGWYRRAVDSATALVGSGPEILSDVADRFHQARRVLNLLADQHLFRLDEWLRGPGG